MKKSILSAFTAALVLGTAFAGTSVQALHDPLLSKNPETTPQLGTVVLVKVPNQEVKDSVHAFAQAWQHATTRIAEVKAKQAEGKELTKNEKKWLESNRVNNYGDYFRTDIYSFVHGLEFVLNWIAENDGIQEYNYETMPGKDPKTGTDMKHGYTNSYGWNVMRGMADRLIEITKKQQDEGGVKSDEEAAALENAILTVMVEDQEHVANEELRHYMNEGVWFTTKQVVKDKHITEPTEQEDHTVDLWQAINRK